MYHEGLGVGKDDVRAYMWLELAARQGYEEAAAKRDEIGADLSAEQIARGLEAAGASGSRRRPAGQGTGSEI